MAPIKFTEKDLLRQEEIYSAGIEKLIETKPSWFDVAIAGLRLYLVCVADLEGPINKLTFVHEGRVASIDFNCTELSEDDQEFFPSDRCIESQQAIACAMIDEAGSATFSYGDLLICAGRMFMVGCDGIRGCAETIYFKHAGKKYRFALKSETVH